jgi:hypothetical protein
LLADRRHAQRLWAHEALFARVFAAAVAVGERRFTEYTLTQLVRRPADLMLLCRAIPDSELRLAVVERFVRHPQADDEVLAAMGASAEVWTELPRGGWTEVPLYRYGALRLASEPGRQFDLHELLPFGTVDRSTAHSLLRSARDSDQLTDRARHELDTHGMRLDIPMPEFPVGTRVQVRGEPRTVRDTGWHCADRHWYYLLAKPTGAAVSKRYLADDLEA